MNSPGELLNGVKDVMAWCPPKQRAVLDDASQRFAAGPQPGDTYLLNPDNPRSFYQAAVTDGVWVFQSCPADMVFNPLLNVCDMRSSVPDDVNPAGIDPNYEYS